MSWFKKALAKLAKEREVSAVRFVGEQPNGSGEQILKERLSESFSRNPGVLEAYLARVEVDGETEIVLCLKTKSGPDERLVEEVARIFKTVFNPTVHLDIMFPTAAQHAELAHVCSAFFKASN